MRWKPWVPFGLYHDNAWGRLVYYSRRQWLLTRSTAIYKNSKFALVSARKRCSLELTSARVSNQRAFKFKANSSEKTGEDKEKEDWHGTEKQPDKDGPEGRADINDGRPSHDAAIKLRLEYLRGIYSETSSDSDFAPYFVQRKSYYCRVLGGSLRGPGPFSNYSPSKCAPCEQRLLYRRFVITVLAMYWGS